MAATVAAAPAVAPSRRFCTISLRSISSWPATVPKDRHQRRFWSSKRARVAATISAVRDLAVPPVAEHADRQPVQPAMKPQMSRYGANAPQRDPKETS